MDRRNILLMMHEHLSSVHPHNKNLGSLGDRTIQSFCKKVYPNIINGDTNDLHTSVLFLRERITNIKKRDINPQLETVIENLEDLIRAIIQEHFKEETVSNFQKTVIFLNRQTQELRSILISNPKTNHLIDDTETIIDNLTKDILSLENQITKTQINPNLILKIGGITIDLIAQKVCCNGEYIHLSSTEFKIFSLLASRRSFVIPTDEIVKKIYDKNSAPTIAYPLGAHINRMCKKLPPFIIQTIHGIGYKFV